MTDTLRSFVLLLGGLGVGSMLYTLYRSRRAEKTVTGGHPRRKLYRHIAWVSLAAGLKSLAISIFIIERYGGSLLYAVPLAGVAFVVEMVAMRYMLSYQNSRLRTFHSAKQVLGTIETDEQVQNDRHLCVKPVGSTDPLGLEEWLLGYQDGELVRLTVERVEEHVYEEEERKFLKRLALRRGESM